MKPLRITQILGKKENVLYSVVTSKQSSNKYQFTFVQKKIVVLLRPEVEMQGSGHRA